MPDPEQRPRPTKERVRRIAMSGALALFLTAGLAAGIRWLIETRHFESTDNAYVGGDIVPIAPQVEGTVIAVHAVYTDLVQVGDELVTLDPADARIDLEQAQAELAQTVREVHSARLANASLAAEIELREANLAKAEQDLARRRDLTSSVAISAEELDHAETDARAARSDLLAAREKLATNRALTGDGPIAGNPRVREAAATLHAAYLDWQRTAVRAPVTGHVARSSVQPGQRVEPGASLMAVVALDRLWVDANFRESQLKAMRIGQPVTLQADMYGKEVTYHGEVRGLGAGTGSAFSLLPPQNATGNWVKVVQRLPVRITLDPEELTRHPLRVGLSMRVKVDIRDRSGHQLAQRPRAGAAARTDVYSGLDRAADRLVAAIIAANDGSDLTAVSAVESVDAGGRQWPSDDGPE